MPSSLLLTSHSCNTQDLKDYIDYLKENNNIPFNDFIKDKYYKEDNNKIIVANLANQEINDLNLTNADLQGVILKEAIFTNCNFTDAVLCDTDLMNTKFNECQFINTDLRGANLHYTDFNYTDINEETLEINNLSEKINGIKVAFSDIEKLNKYIDKDIKNEKDLTAKQKELEEKKDDLKALRQNLDNPGILTAFANRFWNSEENIKEARQKNLLAIEKLQKEANILETEIFASDNLRMFCGNNIDTIFKQLLDENIPVQTDHSYGIGSNAQERSALKTSIKLTEEEFETYLKEAAKHEDKLSLIEFIRKEKKLSADLNIIPDLSDINLAGRELKNLDLRKALFVGANLENTKIINCDMRAANFEGANLQEALFEKVLASDTKFLFADLKGSIIKDSDMSRAYMPKVNLSQSEISNSNFNATIMINADAQKVTVKDTEWNQSNLTGISLAYADMQDVKMRETTLTKGLLDQATIISSNFEKAFIDNAHALGVKFTDCNMKGVVARESYFSDAEFNEMLSLEEADFRKAVMERVKLVNAPMEKALLDQANLAFADLTGATLENASAQFSNLSNAILTKANAEGLNISDAIAANIQAREANLKNLIAERAVISKGDFTKAVLENVNLQCADATESIFKEANLRRANLKGTNLGGINKEAADFDRAQIDDGTQLHDTKGVAKGQVEYHNANGTKNLAEINEISALKDKIHAREQSGWFLKSTIGQFCTKIGKGATEGISSITNLLASKKALVAVAVVVGLAVAAAPFAVLPILAVTGIGTTAAIALAAGGAIVGTGAAIATYKITQKPLLKLKEASKNLSATIDKYISPPPEDIDEKVKEAQQARQNYAKENEKAKANNLNKVENNIDKSKQAAILRQHNVLPPKVKSKKEDIKIDKRAVVGEHTQKVISNSKNPGKVKAK
ncbi:pentapeptide repeat-containing protein [Rickettsia endosymbiont of Aspidapion aeneum]|uniref:pentapeptide repeat-containing protein n=1 Tax=Rickettsia endosymbiont of Aspidapion aeneum TaxID=3066247 RepID=UPI00313C7392